MLILQPNHHTYHFPKICGVNCLSVSECRKLPMVWLSQTWAGRGNTPPRTGAALAALDEALLVFMETEETELRAEVTMQGGNVCEDSCMEFFATFDCEAGPGYLNFEINPIGTLHLAYGTEMQNRVMVEKPSHKKFFEINTGITPKGWFVRYLIPYRFIKEYFPSFNDIENNIEKTQMAGNFYKCGNLTKYPHYGSWNPILSEKGSFHRPEYFGRLICKN